MTLTISQKKATQSIEMFLLVGIMLLIAMGNDFNADYRTYQSLYERYYGHGISYNQEIGFSFLNKLASDHGLSFFQFKNCMLLLSLGFLLLGIVRIVGRTRVNPAAVVLLYSFSYFFSDIIQLRMYLASAITLFGVSFLHERSLKNLTVFTGCLLLAMTIHIAAIVYSSFYLAYFVKSTGTLRRIITVLSIGLFMLCNYLAAHIVFFLSLVSRLGIRDIEDKSLNIGLSLKSVLLLMIVAVLSFFLSGDGLWRDAKNDYLARISALYPLFLVFSCFSDSGGRFLRILTIIYFTDLFRRIKTRGVRSKIVYIGGIALITLIIGGVYWLPVTESFHQITAPILLNNRILQRLSSLL